jgi:hypothetical protein
VELLLAALIVVALVVLGLIARSRRSGDAVADFRRQIDALSPEARRGVTDRVRRLEQESVTGSAGDDADDGSDPGEGARGSGDHGA